MKFKKWLGLILSLAMVLAVSAGVAACGAETSTPKPEHTYSEEWSHDAETHPDDTTDVKGRAAHVDVQEGGDGKCDVCGADMTPPEPEHVYAEGWSHDENSHWHACETHPDDPNDVTEKAGHVDEEGEDGKCDVCGADMTPPEPDHVYAEGWTSDDNYHWHACETHPDDPNDVTEKDGHVDVVDGGDGYCDVCNHAMPKTEPEPEHEHSYTAWEVSEQPAEGHPGKATRHCEDPDCDHSEGEFQEEELPALDEGEYEVEHDLPSCDHEGTDTYTYTLQDGSEVSFTVTVDKIAHSYGDPQWTWNGDEKTGYTGASVKFVCDVCGDEQEPNVEFTRQTVQSGCAQQTVYTATAQFNERQYQDQKSVDTDENAHNHGTGYGELIPQQDPTCTEPGVKAHFHCEVCEKDFDEEHNDITGNLSIDALGHDYTESEWVVKLIPTAGEQGRAEKACKRAGNDEAHEKLTVALPVLGDGRYVITENTAKCVATGTGTYTITLEEGTFTFTAETPALGHDYEKSEWTVELIPTESVEGRAERTCSREGCDDHEGSKESESIPALNRSDVYTSDKIQEKSPATCTKDGTDIYSYTLKDGTTTVTFEVTVPKTGHAYPEEWEITPPTADNTGTATKTCPNCTDEEGHTITVTLPKLSEEEKYTAVTEDTATCTKGGERTYTYHDETYSDDYGDIEFTVQTSVKAHTYNGWKHDDTNHWQQCEVCEEETAHEPHTFEEGYCDTCGAYEKYTLTFDLGDAKDEDLKPVEDKVVYANEPDVNLPGAPTREGFNFKGWECEADSQIYDANHKYTAKGNTKFTAQWEEISAKQCPYNFYITGNGAGDLSRSGAFGERVDQFRLTPSMSGDNTVYTFDSIEIFEGGNFKIISDMDPKDIWAEGTYFSYGGLTKTNPNFKSSDGSSNGNIQATVSGRYKIVLTVDQKGNKISFEITTLQTYTNVKNQFKGYYLTGFMTDPAWVQEPTAYELKGSGSTYTGVFYGVFYLDTAASHATDGKTEVKVIKVTAIMVEDREAGYTVEWYPLKGGDNYTVPATGWYKFTLTVSASGSTFTAKTATEHTHKYTWEITNPTEEGTGQAIGTCNGSGDVPCDKKEVTLTIPSLSDLAKKDINGEGKHSCTEQYTLHYKVTLQDEDETKYEVEFDITHDADPHATDGTWQSDATHHWYECANCDTHVEEAEHEFVGHVCSECSYEAKKVTAHFDVNYKGAETIGDTVEYADYKHESITLPEPNARTGYEFNGWLLNKEGEPQKGSYNITFTDKDTELSFTAKWTAIVYNVTFTSEVQGATLPETPKTTSLEENATFTLAALTLKGYKFDGWFVGGKALSTNEAGAYTFTLNEETIKTAVEKTITVTAKWEANKYTVVFAHDPATVDGEEVTNMPNVEGGVITVEEGKNTITLTKPVRDGYTFVEWQRGNGDTNSPPRKFPRTEPSPSPPNGR